MTETLIHEDIAVVKSISGRIATVEIIPSGSCDNCAIHGVCGGINKKTQHKIETDIHLNIGDKVLLEISPSTKVISSLVLFLMPIVIMLLFYIVPKLSGATEDQAIMSSICSLILSALLIKLLDKVLAKKLAVDIIRKLED